MTDEVIIYLIRLITSIVHILVFSGPKKALNLVLVWQWEPCQVDDIPSSILVDLTSLAAESAELPLLLWLHASDRKEGLLTFSRENFYVGLNWYFLLNQIDRRSFF